MQTKISGLENLKSYIDFNGGEFFNYKYDKEIISPRRKRNNTKNKNILENIPKIQSYDLILNTPVEDNNEIKSKNKYTKKDLVEMSNKDLKDICKKLEVKSSKVKKTMINRILEK